MKVYIDAGHGGSDPGAVKYVVERDVNLVMALACRDYLNANGVNTKMSRTSNSTDTSINSMAREANSWGADVVVSIHNNAGGGDGFEVYHSVNNGRGKTLAAAIEAEVKKIGQNSRGLKTRRDTDGTDYYGMIRLTEAPAVITEGAFVDNATDVKIIDTVEEQKAFGVAIAKGILNYFGIKPSGNTAASGRYLVKVTTDALNIRKGPGTNYAKTGMITDRGTYTIVETIGEWGKLKSGKGYINLNYTKKV